MESAKNREGFDKPYFDSDLRILVVSPNGDYAAHCGMWCIPGSEYAYVDLFSLYQNIVSWDWAKLLFLKG